MTRRTRLRKAGRIAGYAGAGLVALAVVIAIGAPIYFRGERFGQLVERMLPQMRGQIHVGGGRWSWGTLFALLRSRPAPLELDDITVIDPEGTEVLHAEKVSARVEVHRSPARIFVHDLVFKNARWRYARMARAKKVGFLAAFESVPRAGRKKPSKPSVGGEITVAGARLDGVDATFSFPTWGLELHDAHAVGGIAVKGSLFTFEVVNVDVRRGGRLRILGEKSGVVLPIDRGRIERVATTADDRDSIRLDTTEVDVGRSHLTGKGVFTGIYGLTPASKHSGIDFDLHAANAADALNAIAARRGLGKRLRLGGKDADLRLRFTQPFDRIAIDLEARGLDVASGDIDVRQVSFHLAAEPIQGRIRVERLSLASPEGGRLQAEATVDRLEVEAKVDVTRFAARTLLPSALRSFARGTLDGQLQVRADLAAGDAELVRSTLVVRRDQEDGGKGPRAVALLAGKSARAPPGATVVRLARARLVDGVLRVPRLRLSMWGGTLSAEGRVALWDPRARAWLGPPTLDLTLDARGVQIERLIGSGFARGAISFRARARGTTDELTLQIGFSDPRVLTVLGEQVRLPARAELKLVDSTIALGNLPLGGPGESAFVVSGRIGLSGRLALDVGVVRFPIARLPGLSGTTLPVGGSISGGVRIVGAPQAPSLSGEFTLADVTIAKTSLGGGTIAIQPERRGAVRARGQLTDAIAVDGRLAPKATGLDGELALTLTKLPIEPFLPPLPGKLVVRGVVSGSAVARIAPGRPATAEGRLSELVASLSSPAAPGRPAGTLDVRAENEIVMRARAGEGLTLGATRLRGGFGVLEVAGESRGDQLRASLRGRVELGGLTAFARPWVDRMVGAVDVDLTATAHGAMDHFALSGDIAIAAPVALKPAGLSVEASLPSGRLRLAKNVLQTASAIPVVVRGQRFPAAAVRKLEANARVSGRIDGASARPTFAARIGLDRLELQVPLIGRQPLRSAGGTIDLAGDLTTGKVSVTRIDLPITGEAEALSPSPGTTVDRAAAALRVKGDARQLFLTGDVDLVSAHVRADALKASSKGGGGGGASGKPGPLAGHPALEAMRLDVRVRSKDGAVHVDVNNLPDLRVDVDMHVTGTVKKPSISGGPRGANVWSSFVLALAKLFS